MNRKYFLLMDYFKDLMLCIDDVFQMYTNHLKMFFLQFYLLKVLQLTLGIDMTLKLDT